MMSWSSLNMGFKTRSPTQIKGNRVKILEAKFLIQSSFFSRNRVCGGDFYVKFEYGYCSYYAPGVINSSAPELI